MMLGRLVTSPEYTYIKKMAQGVAMQYRTSPGTTQEENQSYLTHCTILWAYNMLWGMVEGIAKIQPTRTTENANDGWD